MSSVQNPTKRYIKIKHENTNKQLDSTTTVQQLIKKDVDHCAKISEKTEMLYMSFAGCINQLYHSKPIYSTRVIEL